MAVSGVMAPRLAGATTYAGSSDSQPPPRCNPSYSSSPRSNHGSDLTHPIYEEEGGETESESPNEPVTPVSRRQSQEFTALQTQDSGHASQHDDLGTLASTKSLTPTPQRKEALVIDTDVAKTPSADSATPRALATPATAVDTEYTPAPLSRRNTRGSTHSFKRTMSNMSSLFKRTSTANSAKDFAVGDAGGNGTSETNLQDGQKSASRPWSMNKSSTTTRSNSPPSPGSPLEMAQSSRTSGGTVPNQDDFKKKNRASTGLSLRGRAVNFVSGNHANKRPTTKHPRRASSFDASQQNPAPHNPEDGMVLPERSPWAFPPDAGTGAKARRMSLSLPDDFTVDVAELLEEYEYQHKFLGRHGKHLGKGATCKVTLMMRKGCPEELYAVKEFRGKSNRESQEEYEKKVKSEYTLAKSLHHPNIVETVRLCTNHGRWNHVMEYCSEGDLFGLVQKGYLKQEERQTDRFCLFKQLIQGVKYLHTNGIAHRDIKLENLLITKDSKLKITDFGVSEVFSGIHPGLREAGGQCGQNMGEVRLCAPGICGSEPYIAPEVLAKTELYDPRALDVWSSAIIMIYLIFGGAIWSKAAPGQQHYDALVKGWSRWAEKHKDQESAPITDMDYPAVKAFDEFVKPPALRRVLLQMLNPNPHARITIEDVINNRWIRNVECCQLESYDDPAKFIDASKKNGGTKLGTKKIFCHNHLPPQSHATHSLGKMPGQAGY